VASLRCKNDDDRRRQTPETVTSLAPYTMCVGRPVTRIKEFWWKTAFQGRGRFFTGEMWHWPIWSNALSCSSSADAVIIFCCVHHSSDARCFLMGQVTHKNCPSLPLGDRDPHLIHSSWDRPSPPSSNRFSRFCRAHEHD